MQSIWFEKLTEITESNVNVLVTDQTVSTVNVWKGCLYTMSVMYMFCAIQKLIKSL